MLSGVEKTIESILPVVLLFLISGLYFSWNILTQREEKNKVLKKIICGIILVCFVYIFAKITLIGRNVIENRKVWLIPLYSYYKYLSGWQAYLFKQDIQNILLFMPFGFFLSVLLGKKTKNKYKFVIVCVGFLVSLFVESVQYLKIIGLFEVDDLIHNTLGTFLGCLAYEIITCMQLIKEENNKWKFCVINKQVLVTNMKFVGYLVVTYLFITLIAYINHLFHVYVLWR